MNKKRKAIGPLHNVFSWPPLGIPPVVSTAFLCLPCSLKKHILSFLDSTLDKIQFATCCKSFRDLLPKERTVEWKSVYLPSGGYELAGSPFPCLLRTACFDGCHMYTWRVVTCVENTSLFIELFEASVNRARATTNSYTLCVPIRGSWQRVHLVVSVGEVYIAVVCCDTQGIVWTSLHTFEKQGSYHLPSDPYLQASGRTIRECVDSLQFLSKPNKVFCIIRDDHSPSKHHRFSIRPFKKEERETCQSFILSHPTDLRIGLGSEPAQEDFFGYTGLSPIGVASSSTLVSVDEITPCVHLHWPTSSSTPSPFVTIQAIRRKKEPGTSSVVFPSPDGLLNILYSTTDNGDMILHRWNVDSMELTHRYRIQYCEENNPPHDMLRTKPWISGSTLYLGFGHSGVMHGLLHTELQSHMLMRYVPPHLLGYIGENFLTPADVRRWRAAHRRFALWFPIEQVVICKKNQAAAIPLPGPCMEISHPGNLFFERDGLWMSKPFQRSGLDPYLSSFEEFRSRPWELPVLHILANQEHLTTTRYLRLPDDTYPRECVGLVHVDRWLIAVIRVNSVPLGECVMLRYNEDQPCSPCEIVKRFPSTAEDVCVQLVGRSIVLIGVRARPSQGCRASVQIASCLLDSSRASQEMEMSLDWPCALRFLSETKVFLVTHSHDGKPRHVTRNLLTGEENKLEIVQLSGDVAREGDLFSTNVQDGILWLFILKKNFQYVLHGYEESGAWSKKYAIDLSEYGDVLSNKKAVLRLHYFIPEECIYVVLLDRLATICHVLRFSIR